MKNKDPLNITNYSCKKCNLHKTRTNVVWGSGNYNSKIVFIGEGPGSNEDQKGEAFVGASGKIIILSIDMINKLDNKQLKKEDLLFLNLVKCRPPENRNPKLEEVLACSNYFYTQLFASKAKRIMTLGSVPWKYIAGVPRKHIKIPKKYNDDKQRRMTTTTFPIKMSIKWKGEQRIFTLFHNMHPAYIARNRSSLPLFVRNLRIALRGI